MTTPTEFIREYERRANSHNFDNVAPLIAKDAVFWFNDGSFQGHDQIRGAFEKTWSAIKDEQYAIDDVSWIAVSEGVAVCLYRFHWKGYVNGQLVSGNGRGTSVLRRDGGGWRIAHEHLSPRPA
jgi:ketosteroid isomerase-like protein